MTLTRKQRESIFGRYLLNPDGARSYLQFRRRVQPAIGGGCVMLPWCGMWLGVETDGYTHS